MRSGDTVCQNRSGGSRSWYDESKQTLYILCKGEFFDEESVPWAIPRDGVITFSLEELAFPQTGVLVLCPATAEGIAALPLSVPLPVENTAADSLTVHEASWGKDGTLSLRYTLLQRNRDLDVVYGEEEVWDYQTSRLAILNPAPEGGYLLERDISIPSFDGDHIDETIAAAPAEGGVVAVITDPMAMPLRLEGQWEISVGMPGSAEPYVASVYPVNGSFVCGEARITVDALCLTATDIILNYRYDTPTDDTGLDFSFEAVMDGVTYPLKRTGASIEMLYGYARGKGPNGKAPATLSVRALEGEKVAGEWPVN